MGRFITSEGLKQLDEYKYKPGGYTWLDDKMNPFWNWCVEQVPLWVAPNLLTFLGWLMVIASYAVMLIYDYTFRKDIPSWTFFFAAVCIFAYSTLDAIDGKQARRTKSSSPLGQLFDHGCDSFSVAFFILAICQAVQLPKEEVFFIFLATQITFYISNWMEYNTGVLTTKVGQFGVTEGEYTCAIIHVITGIMGQKFWSIRIADLLPIQAGDWEIGWVTAYFFGTLLLSMCVYSIVKTVITAENPLKSLGELVPLGILVVMELVWMRLPIYEKYSAIILVNFGIVASLLVCKVIICSVTKMKYAFLHFELVPLLSATSILIILNLLQVEILMIGVLWITFAVDLGLIFDFLFHTVQQITEYLGIYCFSLKKNVKQT